MILGKRLAKTLICGFWVAYATAACAQGADPSKELLGIVHTLQNGAITKIEIIAMPKEVETVVSVTPERLQKGCSVLISMREPNLDGTTEKLIVALRQTRTSVLPYSADLRRGILLYAQDKLVASIYYDRFDQGLVNGVKAKFSGAFLPWVENHIPSDYR